MKNQKLNIEIVMDQFDFTDDGKFFCLKFIDPKASMYRVIRFTRRDDTSDINPDGFMNPKYKEMVLAATKNDSHPVRFLNKLLILMSFNLQELY